MNLYVAKRKLSLLPSLDNPVYYNKASKDDWYLAQTSSVDN